MVGAALKLWNFARSLPAFFWFGVAAILMVGSAVTLAYFDGRDDANLRSKIAVVKIEGLGAKAQAKVNEKIIERTDDLMVRRADILERTDNAKQSIERVRDADAGVEGHSVLADLRLYRDIVERLRDDNERARSDYLAGELSPEPERGLSGPRRALG